MTRRFGRSMDCAYRRRYVAGALFENHVVVPKPDMPTTIGIYPHNRDVPVITPYPHMVLLNPHLQYDVQMQDTKWTIDYATCVDPSDSKLMTSLFEMF